MVCSPGALSRNLQQSHFNGCQFSSVPLSPLTIQTLHTRTEVRNQGLCNEECLPLLLQSASRLPSLTVYGQRFSWPGCYTLGLPKPMGSYPSRFPKILALKDLGASMLWFIFQLVVLEQGGRSVAE